MPPSQTTPQLVVHGLVTVCAIAGVVVLAALGKLDTAAVVPLLVAAIGAHAASTWRAL